MIRLMAYAKTPIVTANVGVMPSFNSMSITLFSSFFVLIFHMNFRQSRIYTDMLVLLILKWAIILSIIGLVAVSSVIIVKLMMAHNKYKHLPGPPRNS